MADLLLAHEPVIRLTVFGLVLAAMVAWEFASPRRKLGLPRQLRWPANIGISVLNTLLVRLAFPMAAVGFAQAWQAGGQGLLPNLGLPNWVQGVIAFVLIDLLIYLQHVAFHRVPWLWRLHRMHHADTDLDVTSGARFHPVEIVLSMLIKLAAIAALGAPPESVLIFEVALNATAMFNHANIRLPLGLDIWLRRVLVTPDMHRVHHSVHPEETNSNFGFNLPWWDRMFGTYRPQPLDGHDAMVIGLEDFRSPEDARLMRLLTLPFR